MMALTKNLQTTTLNIEVENGVDKSGATVYKKKNFSGISKTATTEAINNVAEAIKVILARDTRLTYISDVSVLETTEA